MKDLTSRVLIGFTKGSQYGDLGWQRSLGSVCTRTLTIVNIIKTPINHPRSSTIHLPPSTYLSTQDKAKKNLLLSALVPQNPLLVDNLMSNQALSYEDVKNHLCTLPSNQLKEGFVDGFHNGGGTPGGDMHPAPAYAHLPISCSDAYVNGFTRLGHY